MRCHFGVGPAFATRAVPRLAQGKVVTSIRVAGHTYAYRDAPLEAALDALAGLRLSLVEVWLGHAADGAESVASALGERNLEVAAVSAGGFYTADSDLIAPAFELARAVGAPLVVACVAPAVLDSVVARVPPGITLCVENHWDQPLATARQVGAALARNRGVFACVDTGHAILAGEAPENVIASLSARIGHLHLKDAAAPRLRERLIGRRARRRLVPRPEPAFPGRGALDIGKVRRELEAARYGGTVTLEYEGDGPGIALERLLDEWESSGVNLR